MIVKRMNKFKTDKPFTNEELLNMDIIHNSNTKLFKDQNDSSYIIKDFISEDERILLKDYFDNEFTKTGENINDHIFRITYPMKHKLISNIIRPKIYEHFGDDIIFYSDISKDVMSVGDQFFKAIRPYGLHTDSVTHIDGYRPYKDIIIPIHISGPDSFYVTFNQRYRGHATMFMNGRSISNFPNYHNVVKIQSYEDYGVENLDSSNKDKDRLEKIMPKHIPISVYDGLSIEKVLKWQPRNAIVNDTSVLHAPTEFSDYKIGLTLHLMKEDKEYKNSLKDNYTSWSNLTKPIKKVYK